MVTPTITCSLPASILGMTKDIMVFEWSSIPYQMTVAKGIYEFYPVAFVIVDSVVSHQIDIGQYPLIIFCCNVWVIFYKNKWKSILKYSILLCAGNV